MDKNELVGLSITQAAEMIQGKDISPLELTLAYLERIEELNGDINSYITVNAEGALGRARQAEKELMKGETARGRPIGKLHGIPIALKDLYETKGMRTTHGSRIYADYLPAQDAEIVSRLREAGVVILGKNNMHEIALGLTNVNPHFGASLNPWDLKRITGGSSGGSAAALAASMCLGAMGSDTGGSIRVPAALCGVVGLKPSYGRLSLRGVLPLSWQLDHAGPMARQVLDAAILLQVVAGYDSGDPSCVNYPVDDYLSYISLGVKGWRVALADGSYFQCAASEMKQAIQKAAWVFEDLGAIVERVTFPEAQEAARANSKMVISEAAVVHQENLRERPQDFGEDVLERLRQGARTPVSEYILARRTQVEMRRLFERFFDTYDILLTPTTEITAPLIESQKALEQAAVLTKFTAPFNLSGLPAISLPCGFDAGGLPVGLQIVSQRWAEAKLLRAAFAYERATDWRLRRPKFINLGTAKP